MLRDHEDTLYWIIQGEVYSVSKSELVERIIESFEEYHGVEELNDEQMALAMHAADEAWEFLLDHAGIDEPGVDELGEECYDA